MRLTSCILALTWLTAVLQTSTAAEPVLLRYKPQPDQPLIYQNTVAATQVQKFNDMEMKTVTESNEIVVLTFQEVDDEGHLKFQSENKRLTVRSEMGPLGKYTYDSQANDNEKGSALGAALTPLYDRLQGAIFTVTHSTRGEIVKVDGFKELVADLLKENPVAAQFAGGGTDEAAQMSQQDRFVILPAEPVEPGDEWESEFELPMPNIGTFKGTRKYRYEGMGKFGDLKTAKISVTPKFSADIDIKMGQTQVVGTISSAQSDGVVHFDPERGCVVSLKSELTLSGQLTVTAGDTTFTVDTKQTQAHESKLLAKLPE